MPASTDTAAKRTATLAPLCVGLLLLGAVAWSIVPLSAVQAEHPAAAIAASPAAAAAADAQSPKDLLAPWLAKELPPLVKLYQELHAAPELSFQEHKTAERLTAELKAVGAEVTTGVGKTGVVAVLKNGAGPTLLLRTDLDALPVTELTGLPYASKVKSVNNQGAEIGVMHACGHDIHITNLIGVARFLAAHKSAWSGTVVFIGQPAEEIGAGAAEMLKDGLFSRFPRPDYGLALHVDATLPAGQIGYRAGYMLANVDSVDIILRGRGGHGAQPQNTVDPIVQAAHLVIDLQSIVSREISPFDPAVVTVGAIRGGTKHNIIGDTCHLQLTIRSYTDKVRQHLHDAIRRKAKAAAISANAPEPTITFSDATPALKNDERLVDQLVPVFEQVLDKANVLPSDPSMGGEDFSQYGLAGVPVFMFRLGSVNTDRFAAARAENKPLPSLHSPLYIPDPQPTLHTGISAMSAAVLALLPPAGK